MKFLLLFFAILLAAILGGIIMHADAGYVLIAYKNYSVETTLWVFLLALFLLFLLVIFLAHLLRSGSALKKYAKNWRARYHLNKARRLTNRGLCSWVEGKWAKAERRLVKGAKASEMPLINYLAAARAAQMQGYLDRRDYYLQKAYACGAAYKIAVELSQAQLQITANQYESALATLKHLQQLDPGHIYVFKLLQRVYLQLKDWQNLRALLPELRKYNVLKLHEYIALAKRVYSELLEMAAAKQDFSLLQKVWHEVPREMKRDKSLVAIYVKMLISFHQDQFAEVILRDALKKQWDSNLIECYGLVAATNSVKQLAFAESWLKTHDSDAALYLCLGRICKRQKLWGKAQKYFETSLMLQQNSIIYRELGEIMDELHNSAAALDYYRKCSESK